MPRLLASTLYLTLLVPLVPATAAPAGASWQAQAVLLGVGYGIPALTTIFGGLIFGILIWDSRIHPRHLFE